MHLNEVNGNIIMDHEAMEVLDKRAMEKWQNMKKLPWRGIGPGSAFEAHCHLPSFHYEGGINDDRVMCTGQFAHGMVAAHYGREVAENCYEALACLYNHKGILFVVIKHDSPGWDSAWERGFRVAWTFHQEFPDHVEFVSEDSDHWQSVWSSRRF